MFVNAQGAFIQHYTVSIFATIVAGIVYIHDQHLWYRLDWNLWHRLDWNLWLRLECGINGTHLTEIIGTSSIEIDFGTGLTGIFGTVRPVSGMTTTKIQSLQVVCTCTRKIRRC